MRRSWSSLSARSSRRRRLAISLNSSSDSPAEDTSSEQPASPPHQSPSEKESLASVNAEQHSVLQTVDDDFVTPVPDGEAIEKISPAFSSLPISQRLRLTESMTWIFTGDSDLCSTSQSVETFPRLVADKLKGNMQRQDDIFVNATRPKARMSQIQANLQRRLKKFDPEVVAIVCGFADCDLGVGSFHAFEQSLMQVIDQIKSVGGTPIICTPPCSDVSESSPSFIDRLIFIESLRASAAEHDAVLIDNWEFWQNRSDIDQLWNASEARPSQLGIHELQRLFLSELGGSDTKTQSDEQPSNVSSHIPTAKSR